MPTANQEMHDAAIRHQTYVLRFSAGVRNKINKLLDATEEEIAGRLLVKFGKSDGIITPKDWTRLNELRAVIAKIRGDAWKGAKTVINEEARALAIQEAEFYTLLMTSAAPVIIDAVIPAPETLKAIVTERPFEGKLLKDWVSDLSDKDITRINRMVGTGLVQGRSAQAVARDVFGTVNAKGTDGVTQMTRGSVDMMIRTAMQHINNSARREVALMNSDIIDLEQYSATLDGRTTLRCFPYETEVESCGELEGVFRSEYEGEIVTITTASGNKLTGTPNHPILTPMGFLPLGEFDPFNHIVYSVRRNDGVVVSDKNVSVKPMIGKLFDSLNKPSVMSVSARRASTADFYGDGVGMDGEVDIISINSKLGGDGIPSVSKDIKNNFFGASNFKRILTAFSFVSKLFFEWLPAIKPSKVAFMFFEGGIQPRFRPGSLEVDVNQGSSNAGVEKPHSGLDIIKNIDIALASSEGGHSSDGLEQVGDGRGASLINSSKFSGADSGSVFEDYVVSVKREFKRCHVYTLQSSQGLYTASSILVKNCKALDGKTFKIGEGPQPPLHIGCRSVRVMYLSQNIGVRPSKPVTERLLLKEYTEINNLDKISSRDELPRGTKGKYDEWSRKRVRELVGQVPANTTYNEWLKNQSQDFQVDTLGAARAALFRKGGLSLDRFVDADGTTLTLKEIAQRDAAAFAKAGLNINN